MKYNVIVIGQKGRIDLSQELNKKVRGSALGFHTSWWKDVQFFNRDGYIYVVEVVTPERQLGYLSKLFSSTIYNPTLSFDYNYLKLRKYEVSELQAAIKESLEMDDDVLTQYYDKDEVLHLLSTSNDFDSVLTVLVRCFEGDGND
nr:hypothetical protein [uncultured Undibacterium sp.]